MDLEQSKTKKDEHIEVHLLVNDTNTHAIEAVRVVEDLTEEERYRIGFKYKESNQITYYNKKGETLFALSDVAIMPLMISRNGKRIACERYGVHQPDYPICDTGEIFGATVIYNPWEKNHRAIK